MSAPAAVRARPLATRDVERLLAKRYAPPSDALLFGVRNAAGFDASRTADAIAMGLWPSRGLTLTGFEIKVSRSDWLRELAQPAKADAICCYCDHWYVVAGDETIVRDGELPPTWGLLVAQGGPDGSLRVKVPAPNLAPAQINRGFLAALLRRSVERSVDKAALDEANAAGYKKGVDDGARSARGSGQDWKKLYDGLDASVRAFEDASGVQVAHGWRPCEKIGAAVRAILDGDAARERTMRDLSLVRDRAAAVLAGIDKALADAEVRP